VRGVKFMHNHLYNISLQTNDMGATYCWGTGGGSTEIAYNVIHDVRTSNDTPSLAVGIYLDDNSPNFLIHHNVIYNINSPTYESRDFHIHLAGSNNIEVYNNTIWNVRSDGDKDEDAAVHSDGESSVRVYNNLTEDNRIGGTDIQDNLTTSNPRFVDAANGNFQLRSDSPARDTGRGISGITDGYAGSAPDIGAYEYGMTAWTAGADLSVSTTVGSSGP
jgi:Right handed beta helix region